MTRALENVRTIVGKQIDLLRQIVAGLTDAELIKVTGCAGWRVADLVVHLRLGAEALMAGLARQTDAEADRDFVSSWRDWFRNEPATFAAVRWTWAMTAAYPSADGLLRHFEDLASAAALAARGAPSGRVSAEGHVLDVEDWLATWAFEFSLHHLDLVVELEGRPTPDPDCLAVAAVTLEGLLGWERPSWWDQLTYLRKATGRQPLDQSDLSRLGEDVALLPSLG